MKTEEPKFCENIYKKDESKTLQINIEMAQIHFQEKMANAAIVSVQCFNQMHFFLRKKGDHLFLLFFCFQKILCSLEKKRDLIVVKLKVQLCIVFENHLRMSHFFFWIFHLLVTLFDHKLQVFKNSPN